jgi:RNA-directed DNA polymerase
MDTVARPMDRWQDLPWKKFERAIFKLQTRIFKAEQRGDIKTVRHLQKLLLKSHSAKFLATRRVTRDNQVKKTAGIDGVKSLNPDQRLKLANELKLGHKALPTRRVWIPKPGTQERRGLGIPVMKERAVQALVKMALEPQWESRFEPNSYGFRPGRSSWDAIGSIFNALRYQAKWVLVGGGIKIVEAAEASEPISKLNSTNSKINFREEVSVEAGGHAGLEIIPL